MNLNLSTYIPITYIPGRDKSRIILPPLKVTPLILFNATMLLGEITANQLLKNHQHSFCDKVVGQF